MPQVPESWLVDFPKTDNLNYFGRSQLESPSENSTAKSECILARRANIITNALLLLQILHAVEFHLPLDFLQGCEVRLIIFKDSELFQVELKVLSDIRSHLPQSRQFLLVQTVIVQGGEIASRGHDVGLKEASSSVRSHKSL